MASRDTALQSSIAFLQMQKHASLKRSTSMSEDVFRIYRQTGRRIALIQQQVERERCSYLKESYTEKNQLYKELAHIFHSRKAIMAQQGIDVLSSTPAPQKKHSQASFGEKSMEAVHGYAHKCKSVKELRSINVNVLKRCECCRRRAFRAIEENDDDEDVFDEEAFRYESQLQTLDSESSDTAKTKAGRKISQRSRSSNVKNERIVGKRKTALVQFSRYDDIRMPSATQRVQAGIWALKKQNSRPNNQRKQSKTVRFRGNDSTVESPSVERKTSSDTPASTTRPALQSRASIKVASQNRKADKLHLDGHAWSTHVQDIHEKKINNNNAITGLSKAYYAFRKLLNKMEEEHQAQGAKEKEMRPESRMELPGSRPASNMSRSDSRWVPLRRSSDTLSVRLNTWTTGNLEPTSRNSFEENCVEELEKEDESLNIGEDEKDDSSLHEVYILQKR
ncbi:uncharacterized protein LOC111323180 [Stylophora pistillata]|uniref:uncharacterized protein LOC111323180 n=1 Tax=Stylophora pistillata TaxID=50429 RepID=UPI000C03A424|nr:uncharacterized protein LOC111323180 [Stylophora pistillata]